MHIKVGLPTLLFIIFLVLRLTDHVDWAWYWVASPLWMPAGLFLGLVLFAMVFAGLKRVVLGPREP